jgi:predicted RNA binding protein YcfA (HicA-like mRNA interferase family)
VPHHARDLAEGTLRAILREAGIDVEEFLAA